MTRVFVLTNNKGGCGKTTSAANIALGLSGVLRKMGAVPATSLIRHDSWHTSGIIFV